MILFVLCLSVPLHPCAVACSLLPTSQEQDYSFPTVCYQEGVGVENIFLVNTNLKVGIPTWQSFLGNFFANYDNICNSKSVDAYYIFK